VSGVREEGSLRFLALGEGRRCLEFAQSAIDTLEPFVEHEGPAAIWRALLTRSDCGAQLGHYLQARRTLDEATHLATSHSKLWVERGIRCQVRLARLLLAMGDVDAARDAARDALSASPAGLPLSYQRGLAHAVLAASAGLRQH
jgi:tetratricopeptide (TPR) repeat protein